VDACLCADIEDHLIAIDGGYQPVNGDSADPTLPELFSRSEVSWSTAALTACDDGLLEVAGAEVGIAAAKPCSCRRRPAEMCWNGRTGRALGYCMISRYRRSPSAR